MLRHGFRGALGAEAGPVAAQGPRLAHECSTRRVARSCRPALTYGLRRRAFGIMAASPAASAADSSEAGVPYQCRAAVIVCDDEELLTDPGARWRLVAKCDDIGLARALLQLLHRRREEEQ